MSLPAPAGPGAPAGASDRTETGDTRKRRALFPNQIRRSRTRMSFNELGLSEKVLQAVEASGYTTPTPIQAQSIPFALAGRDVLGIAQTGTGKTAAFVLPMLSRLEQGRARARMPRTLILEPTRELAAQVEESFIKYGVNHRLNVALLIGGVSFGDQEAKIMRGADVLIATPGRLLDFFERGKLLLNGIEILVIDEADRMLDMGFIPDIERICKLVPFTRQTLFFSATMPPEITRLTEAFLQNPARVEVARPASTVETIMQGLVASHGGGAKRETLRRLIRESTAADEFKNAIIFSNRKRDVAILHKSLVSHGFAAGALHGDMDQRARMASLDAFKNGEVSLIVCSDVAARGLDIPDVSHVFNFDVPVHAEDYVHRIGRTGRAGRSGIALSIVTDDDSRHVTDIEKLIGKTIDWIGGSLADLGPDEGHSERPRSRRTSAGSERRERSGGRGRDRTPRPARSEPETVEAAAPEQERAPAEGRRERRPRRDQNGGRAQGEHRAREPRGQAGESRAHHESRPQEAKPHEAKPHEAKPHEAKPHETKPHETRQRRSRHDEHDDPPVVGLGDHVPPFLLRPLAPRERKGASDK
jgi:superfamily II DNA/RNA helicase